MGLIRLGHDLKCVLHQARSTCGVLLLAFVSSSTHTDCSARLLLGLAGHQDVITLLVSAVQAASGAAIIHQAQHSRRAITASLPAQSLHEAATKQGTDGPRHGQGIR
jgi:hypothetical protein